MHVYFVRHGETTLNRKFIHQAPSTPLSERGREQAVTAAEYLRPMNPDLLLTSEYTRAKETARIIGMMLDITPQVHTLFYEVERPSKLCGKSIFSPGTFWYVLTSVMKRNDPTWRYADAENFMSIYSRVQKALRYIESLSETHQSIVIVSHTIFINLMVAYMCHDRILAVRDLLPSFLNIKKMDNCGVVEIQYVGRTGENTCAWQMIYRDDRVGR